MNWRRKLTPIHRWAGLTVGLIVLVSAFTGAGMAFREQLEPVLYPGVTRASPCTVPLSLDVLAAASRLAHPGGTLDYLRIQRDPSAPVAARFLNKDTIYLDRCTAATTASQNRYQGFFGVLEWVHRGQWFAFGGWLMGVGALSLVALLVGIGVYLWWPRKPRQFRQGFTVSRKMQGPAFNIGLHRAVGGWVAIPLLLSAITGLPNAFDALHGAIVLLDGQAEAKPASTGPADPNAARFPLASAWQTIDRLAPNPREVLIHVARAPKDPIEIYIIAADAPHANARTYLWLDAWSGRVLSFVPYSRMGAGSRLYFWMLSLHTGEVGGLAGQCILFLGAIGALVLGYTGITAYIRRRFKLDKKQRKKPAISALPVR
ncbi:MAG: PepSY-associated TM helix domain-containing protein [Sphingomonas sp.]